MEKYQIIPRKFRPKQFSEVAGQEPIVTTLKNALSQKRIGQAYLFCGSRGCGKTTLARLFAKALNCAELNSQSEPCNQCSSCLDIAEGRSLDLIEIDGASNRGIDDIRQLNETVGYAPSKGHYKIYIIDEVHMLTKEAFNALLKTLEEPPKTVKFFFATTEPHKVPQTIISRCQRFNLSRIPENALIEKLERICSEISVSIEKDALLQISRLSEGSLRDAESMLDQLICFGKDPITFQVTREFFGLLSQEHLLELDRAIQTHNIEKAIELAIKLYESGKDLDACIDNFIEHFRTHLLISMGHSPQKQLPSYSKDQCLTILETLMEWQQQMGKTPFKEIHLEILLVQLVKNSKRISLNQLIDRLLDLEARICVQPETSFSPIIAPLSETLEMCLAAKASEPLSNEIESEKTNILAVPVEQPSPLQEQSFKEILSVSMHPSKYDTLIRFAAVELEGSIQLP